MKKELTIADKVSVAKEYISKGYAAVLVLKIGSLNRFTYYYHIAMEDNIKSKLENVGRPVAGYSLTKEGTKICDEQIKEYIMEAIQDEAFYYGYYKITYHLRNNYNLTINHKKVYRLCKKLQRRMHTLNPSTGFFRMNV